MGSDYLKRGIAFNGLVRAVAIDLTETVRTAQSKHDCAPTATAALGRLMIAAAVMGSTLKDKQQLTLKIKGDGPLGSIVANIDDAGNVRGYVDHPHELIPPKSKDKLDVAGGVGRHGMLYVIKDLGFGEPFQGTSQLVSGEVAQDIAYYYVVSEQIPTVFAAGVRLDQDLKVAFAGGYLLQLLPDATDEIIDLLEQKVKEASSVTKLMEQGMDPDQILEFLLGDADLKILPDVSTYRFECRCSKEYLASVLLSVGAADLRQLATESTKDTEVCCQYCSECYLFSAAEIQVLLDELAKENE